jgi:hypothetical protein
LDLFYEEQREKFRAEKFEYSELKFSPSPAFRSILKYKPSYITNIQNEYIFLKNGLKRMQQHLTFGRPLKIKNWLK